MNETVESGATSVLDALTRAGLTDAATLVLIGSGARDTMNGRSDIDILVLHDDGRRIRLKRPGNVHLQQDSRSRFLRRLEDGDDYPGWALRFGTPIRDPDGLVGQARGRRAGQSSLAGLASESGPCKEAYENDLGTPCRLRM